jgi:hypothetical protein
MHCQPNVRWTITPTERPVLVQLTRALERALDDLPDRRSPWWATLDRLHHRLAQSLEPGVW